MTLAACTIVSKNYIAFARVLAESFRRHHPGGQFFVLLVDRNEGSIDPGQEPFTLVEVETLDNIPDREAFLFKYTILECNTAVKPYFLEYLLERYGFEKLVYFDPDILITGSLEDLDRLLDQHSIVLTPHLTEGIDDGAHPDEIAILQAGAYNLGFLALRRTEITHRLLSWWQARLFDRCVVSIEEGLFVDQKWIDLVPGIFKDVYILTNAGYNVAYWNLHDRRITVAGDEIRSNDSPLVFFHFSGIDPDNLQPVSKHQDRYTLADVGDAAHLYHRYRDLLLAAGHHEARRWPYAYGVFDNGVSIPPAARTIFLRLGNKGAFGNPFEASGPDSFFQYLNGPRRAGGRTSLSHLLGHLYEMRPDLQRKFPDVDGQDFLDFSAWLLNFGRQDFRLDEAFLVGLARDTPATLVTGAGLRRRARNAVTRLYRSRFGQLARQTARRLLGRRRYQALQQRVRGPQRGPELQRPVESRALPLPSSVNRFGVNLVGYFRAETGMGEVARALARAFETTGIPVSRHSLDLNVVARQGDNSVPAEQSDFPYDVNVFVVNADQVQPVFEHLGSEVFGGRVNVGFWLWELERFPDRWRGAFDLLHEIWTPSSFCVDSISRVSPVPVRRVPIPVETTIESRFDRAHFDLPEDVFVFLFSFNFLSYLERKNPLAVIRAFRQAFGDDNGVLLVLKTSQSDFASDIADRLEKEVGRATNVRLIDGYLDRAEITALTALSDAYVSLHRSEGFGLTLAEAMLLGKGVVATAYSGVADFFDLNNGFPVRYSLVELSDDIGPYPAGAHWAEPDVEHAAELMQRLRERRVEDRARLERARRDIEEKLSYASVGRELEHRVREIVSGVERAHRAGGQ